MKKTALIILIFSSLVIESQTISNVEKDYYLMIESGNEDSLYNFKQTNEKDWSTLTVVRFDKKNLGYLGKVKLNANRKIEAIPHPNPYVYVYYSNSKEATEVNSIEGLQIHSITEFSKHELEGKKRPGSIVYIIKTDANKYLFYKMLPIIRE